LGQERPPAAAAGRRAGPVLAPLRAAGPAAAHTQTTLLVMANPAPLAFTGNTVAEVSDDVDGFSVDVAPAIRAME
jgi:hypothetical protein